MAASSPGLGDVFVSTLLSNVLVGWIQDQTKFMSTRLFPMVPVDMQQGIVPQYKIGDLYRNNARKRAVGTEAASVGWNTDNTLTYYCEERAEKHLIADPVRATTQNPYDQDRDATKIVGQQMLINRESDFITAYWNTSLWGKDWTGQNTADSTHKTYWDVIGSTPIEDISLEMDRIEGTTGFRPNKLALGATVFTGLKNNAEFLDRVKFGGGPDNPALVNEQAMAQVFGVDEVIRAAAVSNTAVEGATDSISFMAGKSALLLYAAPAPSIFMPSAGYTFPWRSVYGAPGDLGFRIKKYRWEILEGDFVEAQAYYDMKIIANNLGTFFSNISST